MRPSSIEADDAGADTPASTVSVKRRRRSSWRLASISSRRWLSSWLVMRLNAAAQRAEFVFRQSASGTRAPMSPARTRSAASIRRADRRHQRRREVHADPDRGHQQQQRHHDEDQREDDLEAGRACPRARDRRRRPPVPLHVTEDARLDRAGRQRGRHRRTGRAGSEPAPGRRYRSPQDDFALAGRVQARFPGRLELAGRRTARSGPASGRCRRTRSPRSRPAGRLRRQHLAEATGVGQQARRFAVEVVRHRQRVGADQPAGVRAGRRGRRRANSSTRSAPAR